MGNLKRRWALVLVMAMIVGSVFSANAANYDGEPEYFFEVDVFDNELASDLLGDPDSRLAIATMIYSMAAYHIDDIRATFENPDAMTRVYLASLSSNPRFFRMYFFAPGETWIFTCNTVFGQIAGGPMNYTMVPGAADMVMTSLQSDGTIGNYYSVEYSDIYYTLMDLAAM